MWRRSFLPLLAAPFAGAQEPVDFVCPMDPEVHAKAPGRCPRCGMLLEPGLPEPLEYRLAVDVAPKVPLTSGTTSLRFSVIHPKTGKRVEKFREIHEKLFHLFLISEDLRYFAHEHPEPEPGGYFRFHTNLPLPGYYRMLADFYPDGGTPQLLTAPLFLKGKAEAVTPPQTVNLTVRLRMEPEKPVVGLKTMLFFSLDPFAGVTEWLGAWGHLLCASEDLLDLVHAHPVWEPYQNQIQFNLIFPRPGRYRLWGQFQRQGVVNTAVFDVNAVELG